MRVLLSTYGSRGDVEPMVGLALQLRALGAEGRVCAPPDEEFAELLAGVGVPLVPFGQPWRSWVRPSAPEERTRRVAESIAAQYDTVAAAAEGCDVLLATGMSHFVAQSVAEKVAIHPPPVRDLRASVLTTWTPRTGTRCSARRSTATGHRSTCPVDDVRGFMFTGHPWLAADPTLGLWDGSSDTAAGYAEPRSTSPSTNAHNPAATAHQAAASPNTADSACDQQPPTGDFSTGQERGPQLGR